MRPTMGLFDVHAHLTNPRLFGRVDEILDRARSVGVTTIVSNGLHPVDNQKVLDLAAKHDIVKPAVGLYPVDAVLPEMLAAGIDYPRDDVEPLPAEEAIEWVREHAGEALAVGEIGLDHHWVPEEFWARQEKVFRALVKVAMDADKPIIIHTRRAETRAFEILQEMGAARVDWHCFGSRVKLGRRIAAAGHYLSIPANARKSESFSKLLETLPRDRVLLETDCPYLGPVRGEDNEPANVAGTVQYAAELWKTTPEAVQAELEENFKRLFGVAP